MRRYHWWVLPQGMKNSPSICQCYIAKISPTCKAFPKAFILHYMADVLLCTLEDSDQTLSATIKAVEKAGLEIEPKEPAHLFMELPRSPHHGDNCRTPAARHQEQTLHTPRVAPAVRIHQLFLLPVMIS